MASISYQIFAGQTLEQVTAGTAVPSGGSGAVELRIDQTALVTDASIAGGVRPLNRGDILAMLRTLEQYFIRDPNVFQQ